MNQDFSFEGNRSDLYNYLTKELKIAECSPKESKTTGRHQITPLKKQIEKIYSSPSKSGKIYFSHDYKIEVPQQKTRLTVINEKASAFQICTVLVKIVE